MTNKERQSHLELTKQIGEHKRNPEQEDTIARLMGNMNLVVVEDDPQNDTARFYVDRRK